MKLDETLSRQDSETRGFFSSPYICMYNVQCKYYHLVLHLLFSLLHSRGQQCGIPFFEN